MNRVARYPLLPILLIIGLIGIAMWPALPAPAQSLERLPVFRLTKITAGNDTTLQLGGVLEGIGRAATAANDTFNGKPRFLRLNEQNRTVLTQYARQAVSLLTPSTVSISPNLPGRLTKRLPSGWHVSSSWGTISPVVTACWPGMNRATTRRAPVPLPERATRRKILAERR